MTKIKVIEQMGLAATTYEIESETENTEEMSRVLDLLIFNIHSGSIEIQDMLVPDDEPHGGTLH